MTTTSQQPTPAPVDGRLHLAAVATLLGLLLVLALRLTMTEALDQMFSQVNSLLYARTHPNDGVVSPEIGPAVTMGLSALTVALTAAAAWISANAGALSLQRFGKLLLIALILALGFFSTLHAAARFSSLDGLCDLALSLLGAWGAAALCHPRVLGSAGRRILITCLISILTIWIAKGLYQRLVELPDTVDYFNRHKEEALASQGLHANDPGAVLYESRMNSMEVAGYVTLSNVMGAGLIGLLATLAGLLAGKMVSPEEPPPAAPAPRSHFRTPQSAKDKPKGIEIPAIALMLYSAALLVPLGIIVLILTKSRGGSIFAIAAMLALFAGAFWWKQVIARRRMLVAAFLGLWLLVTAAVVAFGLHFDRLPTKSLMFRWHYWTASVPLVREHPLTGVGLNNFGDYYASVKRLSSPETVQDPHSFFVRFAAELGIPATLLIALLILWCLLAAVRVPRTPETPATENGAIRLYFLGLVFCTIWWTCHQLLAETGEAYSLILSVLSAVIAIAGWLVAGGILTRLNALGLRIATLSLLVGALGMLAYDQINMALVTGPVATLFWFMLMATDTDDAPLPSSTAPATLARFAGVATSLLLAAGSLSIATLAWYPTLNGTMPWDDRPPIERYLLSATATPPNFPAAREALTHAIELNPRSVALRRQLMQLKERFNEPVDDDARTILSMDHTDMRIRLNMATEPSSLPASERLRILHEILFLNDQLPADDVMRLTPDEHKQIADALAALQPAASQPATAPAR